MSRRWLVVLFAAGCATQTESNLCAGIDGVCLDLTVTSQKIKKADTLQLTASGAVTGMRTTTAGKDVPLPLHVALQFPAATSGELHLNVVALDQSSTTLGSGQGSVTLVAGRHASLTVAIAPAGDLNDLAMPGGMDLSGRDLVGADLSGVDLTPPNGPDLAVASDLANTDLVGVCVPNCAGKVCGSDGCTGTCGSCSGTQPMCASDGSACLCTGASCVSPLTCNGSGACTCPTGTTENCFNGMDDNCDGLIDCADPQCASPVAICVPTAPGGFSYGYVSNTGCPGASTNLIVSATSPANCTGCGGCGGSGTCTTTVHGTSNSGNCSTAVNTSLTVNATYPTIGQCSQGSSIIWSATHAIFDPPTWGGSCTPSGSPQKPALNITNTQFCSTSQIGGGCGGGSVCVPAGNTCVSGSGSCTGATKTTYHTGIDDSGRGCASCSGCSVATAGDCSLTSSAYVIAYTSTDCSGTGDNFYDSGAGYCSAKNYHSYRQNIGAGAVPTCSGTPTAAVTGAATLTGAVTVCCQ